MRLRDEPLRHRNGDVKRGRCRRPLTTASGKIEDSREARHKHLLKLKRGAGDELDDEAKATPMKKKQKTFSVLMLMVGTRNVR